MDSSPKTHLNGSELTVQESKLPTDHGVSINVKEVSDVKSRSFVENLNLSPSLMITLSTPPDVNTLNIVNKAQEEILLQIGQEQVKEESISKLESHDEGDESIKDKLSEARENKVKGINADDKVEITPEDNVKSPLPLKSDHELEEGRPKRKRKTLEEANKKIQEGKVLHSEDEEDEKWLHTPSKKKGRKSSLETLDPDHGLPSVSPIKRTVSGRRLNPFKRPSITFLKKTGASYLQDDSCTEIQVRSLGKCRECRYSMYQSARKRNTIFCRFYAFRKLRYAKNGVLSVAGFSEPMIDPKEEDMRLWLPSKKSQPVMLDSEMARFLISKVGDQFCELIHQEKEVGQINISENDKPIAWKRLVQGIREMCDVCETTLFNFHFACGKCGFGVCLQCYKARKNGTIKTNDNPAKLHDEFNWLHCTHKQPHQIEKLMLTQAIAGDSLEQMADLLHKVRAEQKIPQDCGCKYAKKYNDIFDTTVGLTGNLEGVQPLLPPVLHLNHQGAQAGGQQIKALPKKKSARRESSSEDSDQEDESSSLRELLGPKPNKRKYCGESENGKDLTQVKKEVPLLSGNGIHDTPNVASTEADEELKHFVRIPSSLSSHYHRYGKLLPVLVTSLAESSKLNPTVPHTWLCGGKLLRLLDPSNPGNYTLFQEVWKRGQPVVVSNVSARLNKSLWTPESFSQDFGEVKNDLINCMNGKLVLNQPMKTFWDGFEYVSKRLKDEQGDQMLLKLKDWPAGDDFAEMLPSRFKDLMAALPLTEYTHRTGRLNLAARLPDNFVKPDLGPKMYIAYGSGLHLEKGTTNLHLDISDAVNLMVHASVPLDSDNTEHNAAVLQAITDSDCDVLTSNRVTDDGELPGALWHIYNARDADKIRDLLNKVALERGERLERHNDPIHDQSGYLDRSLRKRLMEEYNVIGYPIVQCLGDAVFIPAGAPHQVRNLQNCIKIAEDFVSPENVSHCFHLTEEFRNLSETHTNREDKLQIKNIIYHAVKDGLSVLATDLPETPQLLQTQVQVETQVEVNKN